MASVEKLPMLAEGYEKLTAEIKALREERPRIVDAIEKMRNITQRKSGRVRSRP